MKRAEGGFALLLTLIVVAVTLAIGLSLLNITLKQFTLSSTARDSEVAFHVSNSGLECMQAYRASAADTYLAGGSVSANCGEISDAPTRTSRSAGGGTVHHYEYEFEDFGSGDVCVETSMYIVDMRASTSGLTNYAVNEGLEDIDCAAGVVCTTIFSRGYNRNCGDLSSIRTVQRELTVQF